MTPKSPTFHERIQHRLQKSRADLERRREEMERQMAELEQSKERFDSIASQLLEEVLQPILQELAAHFDNARLDSPESAAHIRYQLCHCLRFPALANVQFSIMPHPTSTEEIVVRYHAEVLPVFIQFERDDEYCTSAYSPEVDAVRQWAELKVLGFLDAYLQIETHKQYQSHNMATDPVCGMQVPKPQALTHDYAGETYYFCAQRCVDRFAERPEEYINVTEH